MWGDRAPAIISLSLKGETQPHPGEVPSLMGETQASPGRSQV